MGIKMINDRIRLADTLDRLLGGHPSTGSAIAEGRAKLLGPELREGETLPDSKLEIDLWLRRLPERGPIRPPARGTVHFQAHCRTL